MITRKTVSGEQVFQKLTGVTNTAFEQRPYLDETFVKFHLAIDADSFRKNLERGAYPYLAPEFDDYATFGRHLEILKSTEPKAKDFLYFLKRVGEPYGWNLREKYQKDNLSAIKNLVKGERSNLYSFMVNGNRAGFCLTTRIDYDHVPQPLEKGIMKSHAVEKYKEAMGGLSEGYVPVEIYKIGLYPEYTNQGLGNYFLQAMMWELLIKNGKGIIYLDTRDTNHEGVLNFYAQNGVQVFFKETLKRDIVFDRQCDWPEPRNDSTAKSIIGTSVSLSDGSNDNPGIGKSVIPSDADQSKETEPKPDDGEKGPL